MSKVVLLDPGHGGYDPGAVANGLKEKDLNLQLALKVAEKLSCMKVLLTRERDSFVSLAERVNISRRSGADLFLSLHANAGGGQGFESFIYSGLGNMDPVVKMQKALHGQIMEALRGWNIVDRGMKRAVFYVLKHNPRPAVLIESLFLDNEAEANLWREPFFIEALAEGVAGGVRKALGLSGGDSDDEQPALRPPVGLKPERSLYTVQVGAFAYIENARQRLSEAQEAGFKDAFIYQKRL